MLLIQDAPIGGGYDGPKCIWVQMCQWYNAIGQYFPILFLEAHQQHTFWMSGWFWAVLDKIWPFCCHGS